MTSLLAAQKLTDLDPLAGYDDRDYEYEEPTEEIVEEEIVDDYPTEEKDIEFERTNDPFCQRVDLGPYEEWLEDGCDMYPSKWPRDRYSRRDNRKSETWSSGHHCFHLSGIKPGLRQQLRAEAERETRKFWGDQLTALGFAQHVAYELNKRLRALAQVERRYNQLSWKATTRSVIWCEVRYCGEMVCRRRSKQWAKQPDQIGRRAAKRREREQKLELRRQKAASWRRVMNDPMWRADIALTARHYNVSPEEALTFFAL